MSKNSDPKRTFVSWILIDKFIAKHRNETKTLCSR